MKTYLEKLNTKIQKYKKIWKQNICNKILIEICRQTKSFATNQQEYAWGDVQYLIVWKKNTEKKQKNLNPLKKNIHNAKKYAKNG